jgi:hypothetical protein
MRHVFAAFLVAVGIGAGHAEARMPQRLGVELQCSGSSADGLTIYVNVTSAPAYGGRPFAIALSAERTAPGDGDFPELDRPRLVLTSRSPAPRLDANGSATIALDLPRTLVPLPDQLFLQAGVQHRDFRVWSNVLPYSPRGEKFVRAGDLLEARTNHTATRLADERVLVTGGLAFGNRALATAEVFDPNTSTFVAAAAMSTARFAHTATMIPRDGRVLIAGGFVSGSGPATASVELYDPIADRFVALEGLRMPRARHAAVAYIDPKSGWPCVLVAGGAGAAAKTAEVLDVSKGKFALAGGLLHDRVDGSAVVLADGRIAIAGGTDVDGRPQTAVDLYDPLTRRFGSSATMLLPRTGAAIAPTPDGSFVVIGGQVDVPGCLECPTRYLHRVERFDPEISSFQFEPSPCAASRSGACAALLDGGLILVTGGGETSEVFEVGAGFRTVGCLSSGLGCTVTPLRGGQALVVGGSTLRRAAWVFTGL